MAFAQPHTDAFPHFRTLYVVQATAGPGLGGAQQACRAFDNQEQADACAAELATIPGAVIEVRPYVLVNQVGLGSLAFKRIPSQTTTTVGPPAPPQPAEPPPAEEPGPPTYAPGGFGIGQPFDLTNPQERIRNMFPR